MTHFLILSGIAFLLQPEQAHAQVTNIITGIGGGGGAGAAQDMFAILHNAGRSLLTVISVAMLVRAAAKMIGSISEEKMEEGRKSVGATIGGIILINLSYAFVSAFWGGGDQGVTSNARQLTNEIHGLVEWAQVLVGILAVAMIVVSAFKGIASFGKDDAADDLKKSVTGAIVGILLVVFDGLLISTIGGNGGRASPQPLIGMIIMVVSGLLKYLALLAVCVIIYAGIMMIVRVGSDDQYDKSKSLIVRVLIGLVIVLFSYFIVNFISSAIFGMSNW